jgi:class 3 adenylate cyclase
MPRLQAKSFKTPDDVRTLPKVRFETVGLDDATVGHCRFDPGWRWSVDVGPMVGSASCPIRHLGYSMSGTVRVVMDDGQTLDIEPGMVFDVPPGHDKWVVGDEPWITLEWGASGRALGAALQGPSSRSLATVVLTDIVDSTVRLQQVGDAVWREQLAAHHGRLREAINVFRGREIKTTGDGLLVTFDSPTRAVQCAAEMVRTTRDSGLQIRVGIHTGEIELVGDDIRGIAVHTAARVMALAGASEVLLSSTTGALAEGSGLDFEDAGVHALKGLPGERQIFRLVLD